MWGEGGLRQEEIAIRKQTTVGGSSKTLFACFVTTDTVYSILLVDLQHVMFKAYFKVRNQSEMSVVLNYDYYHKGKKIYSRN